MKPFLFHALLGPLTALCLPSLVLAQEDTTPEIAAIQALDRQYESAFAKGDAAALANFFATDAEQTTEDGTVLSGRKEIEESLRNGLKAAKGARLSIAMESARLLAPEVLLEKGTSSVIAADGSSSTSRYSALYVRKEGAWKITQLIETSIPPATPREHLEELAWLVGDWLDTDHETTIESSFQWARGGNFLTRNLTVKREGKTTHEGWQVIGWYDAQGRIRSWTFDTAGGFSEGTWTREGDRWLVIEAGTVPDGDRTTSQQTITKVSPERFTWESNHRTLNGDPQPGIGRIEITRVKGR